jgi:hypothetical protein
VIPFVIGGILRLGILIALPIPATWPPDTMG